MCNLFKPLSLALTWVRNSAQIEECQVLSYALCLLSFAATISLFVSSLTSCIFGPEKPVAKPVEPPVAKPVVKPVVKPVMKEGPKVKPPLEPVGGKVPRRNIYANKTGFMRLDVVNMSI